MLNKEECEIALENAVDAGVITKDWKILNQLIEEHFDKNGNVKVLANIVIDEDKMKEIIDEEIKKLIVPEPYKFEDLKPNMWVYDIKVKWLFKIVSVDIGIEALKHYVFIVENRDGSTSLINFEENRFFPVQYANLIKMEVKEDG